MWQIIAGIIIAAFLVFALTPKPQNAPRPGIGDIKAPTASAGREISVLFGCRTMRAPNVVWWGDLRTTPIKSSTGSKK